MYSGGAARKQRPRHMLPHGSCADLHKACSRHREGMLGAELEVGLAYEVVVKGAMVGMGHLQRT